MNFDDYKEAVLHDAIEAIENGEYDYLADRSFDDVHDEMWVDDAITGNGSGSYTFSTYQAELNTAELVYDNDFLDRLGDLGMGIEVFKQGAEAVDVTARCLALGDVSNEIEDAWQSHCEELDMKIESVDIDEVARDSFSNRAESAKATSTSLESTKSHSDRTLVAATER